MIINCIHQTKSESKIYILKIDKSIYLFRYLSDPEATKDLDPALLQSIPKAISSFYKGDIPLILNPLLKKSSDW